MKRTLPPPTDREIYDGIEIGGNETGITDHDLLKTMAADEHTLQAASTALSINKRRRQIKPSAVQDQLVSIADRLVADENENHQSVTPSDASST